MSKKKLVTHNGKYHADEVFATAVLQLYLEKAGEDYEILRTRDEEIIADADYVFDVGGVYDPENNRFDHHQQGGAGKRENGIDYATFGLVWKKFGKELCGSGEVADAVDKRLIVSIDADDSGIDLYFLKYEDVLIYPIWEALESFIPTWKEDESKTDEIFLEVVAMARKVLEREIKIAQDKAEAAVIVEKIYKESEDKRLIVLDAYYPWKDVIMQHPEPLFVVNPRKVGHKWDLHVVPESKGSFGARKDLPASWAGLVGEELQKETGVSDAVFCHRSLFLAGAGSKEGIMELAKQALEA
jgi:uncharacterized UPF0160 family protein